MPAFASLSQSLESCIKIILGEADFYDDMLRVTSGEGGNPTSLFYWSLIGLGLVLGMNIIIAILMSGFEKARQVDTDEAPSGSTTVIEKFEQMTGLYVSPRKRKALTRETSGRVVMDVESDPKEAETYIKGINEKVDKLQKEMEELKNMMQTLLRRS